MKIVDNGTPYAIMANAAGDDAGEALVTSRKKERDAFWQCVEILETPRARLAPFLKRRLKATWLKAGLSSRVRHLRGEEKLRHAKVIEATADQRKGSQVGCLRSDENADPSMRRSCVKGPHNAY